MIFLFLLHFFAHFFYPSSPLIESYTSSLSFLKLLLKWRGRQYLKHHREVSSYPLNPCVSFPTKKPMNVYIKEVCKEGKLEPAKAILFIVSFLCFTLLFSLSHFGPLFACCCCSWFLLLYRHLRLCFCSSWEFLPLKKWMRRGRQRWWWSFLAASFSIKEKEEVRREEEINDRAMHKTWHTHLAFGCHPFFQDIIISCVHRTTDVKYSFCDRDWRQIRRQIFLESLSLLSVTDRFLKLWRGNRFDVVSLSFCCQSPSLVSSMEWEVSTFSSPMKSVCEFTDKRVKEERARKLLKRDRQLENWVKPTGILSSSLALFLHSINFVQSFERKRKKEKRKETSEIEARKEIELKGESKMFVSFPHFLEWCLLLVFRVLRHTILSGIPLESRFNIPITSTDVKFLLTPSSCDETNPQEARMLFSPRFTWSVIVYSLIIRLNYWEIKRSLRWWWSGRGYYTKVIATSSPSSGKEGIYSVSLDPLDMICVSFIPCVSWHRLIFVCVFLLLNFSLPFIGILTANDFCMIIETCISWYDVVTDICNLWSSRKGWASFCFRDEAFSLCFRVFNQFHHKRQKGRNTLWSISSWDLCTYFGFFLLLGLGCWCSSRKIKHHSHEQSAYQTNIKSRDWTWEVSKVETRSFAKKEEACSNKVNCASNIIHI